MQITDLSKNNFQIMYEVAVLLQQSLPNGWPDMESALAEVRESFADDRISRVALGVNGKVLGWIGGISTYSGNVWELHPLVVRKDSRKQGIGRALVADLEVEVSRRGGYTIWLGTDDEDQQTTLSGVDLYVDIPGHIKQILNLKGHPYEFYQKVGFVITGVLPDANGPGKPDIFMAKRVRSENSK